VTSILTARLAQPSASDAGFHRSIRIEFTDNKPQVIRLYQYLRTQFYMHPCKFAGDAFFGGPDGARARVQIAVVPKPVGPVGEGDQHATRPAGSKPDEHEPDQRAPDRPSRHGFLRSDVRRLRELAQLTVPTHLTEVEGAFHVYALASVREARDATAAILATVGES
jgi:hypothetical protein